MHFKAKKLARIRERDNGPLGQPSIRIAQFWRRENDTGTFNLRNTNIVFVELAVQKWQIDGIKGLHLAPANRPTLGQKVLDWIYLLILHYKRDTDRLCPSPKPTDGKAQGGGEENHDRD